MSKYILQNYVYGVSIYIYIKCLIIVDHATILEIARQNSIPLTDESNLPHFKEINQIILADNV